MFTPLEPRLRHQGQNRNKACRFFFFFLTPVVSEFEQVSCRLAVSRSLGDRQFKGQGGQPPDSDVPPPPDMTGQLVSPEPSVSSVQLEPSDRVVIVASGRTRVQACCRRNLLNT